MSLLYGISFPNFNIQDFSGFFRIFDRIFCYHYLRKDLFYANSIIRTFYLQKASAFCSAVYFNDYLHLGLQHCRWLLHLKLCRENPFRRHQSDLSSADGRRYPGIYGRNWRQCHCIQNFRRREAGESKPILFSFGVCYPCLQHLDIGRRIYIYPAHRHRAGSGWYSAG